MAQVTLRPDLKTSGGEVCDITWDGRYVGTMVLVIREGHRVAGSVQLEQDSLTPSERKETMSFIQNYVEQTVAAVQAQDCEVVVTCSPFDHIIASEHQVGVVQEFLGPDEQSLLYADEDEYGYEEDDDTSIEDVDPDDIDSVEMLRDPSQYELVIVGESRNRVEYHIYDRDEEWIAEVFLRVRGSDITGEINWIYEPLEDEIEQVAELIVADFDEDEVDTIRLDMLFDGELLETMELTHEDLLEDEDDDIYEAGVTPAEHGSYEAEQSDYSIILARDDGDALTYEIYEQSHGGLPVGSAMVDISQRGLTGYIEFRDSASSEDREKIGALLMQELDKEKDYDSVHLTMLLNNQPIDEILYETEPLH
jgi:hypothetical protein